jgi:hypothetical protein
MTVFAEVGGRRVVRRLARRRAAVVAAHAIPDDVGMIEEGASPGHGVVALGAIVAGDEVARMLPRRHHPVVTGRTARRHTLVIESVRVPGGRRVAVLAVVVRRNVRGRLARRGTGASHGMASRAGGGSALEHSTLMAGLAAGRLVSAREGEARFEVVEILRPR